MEGEYGMTRKEEIEKEAFRVSYDGDEFQSFIQGAEWADKTMIDKACEWLSDIDFDMEYWNFEDGFFKEKFIKDFKKAMEEVE